MQYNLSVVYLVSFIVPSLSQISEILNPIRTFFNVSGGPIRETENIADLYDFVIIGAGSGGSVVANRLSENQKWSVLILEAGGDEIFLSDIPLTSALLTATAYNWGYKSEKVKTACLGLINQRCNMPRGKALGGTSVINFLLYTRGNRRDFDEWSELGNEGWSYDEILHYFIKSENCTFCENINPEYHGYKGYLNVEHAKYSSPTLKAFLKAGTNLGYRNTDPNGRLNLGFSIAQATMRNGMRCSASKAFLKSVQQRPNLEIAPRARVTKILIDPNTKSAYAVEFVKNKKKYVVRAAKEVILSAGSINSPHLLMLSGIGPKRDLERVGIPVIQDLKVGYNLQDHMALSTLAFLVNESITVSDLGVQNPVDIFHYIFESKGPYTIPGGAEALAFVKTRHSAATADDYPDIELVLGSGALNGDLYGSLRNLLGIPDSFFRGVYGSIANKPAFSIAPVLMRPRSKGRVLIKSANPFKWPVLKPNYFGDAFDTKVLIEGIKMVRLFLYCLKLIKDILT